MPSDEIQNTELLEHYLSNDDNDNLVPSDNDLDSETQIDKIFLYLAPYFLPDRLWRSTTVLPSAEHRKLCNRVKKKIWSTQAIQSSIDSRKQKVR